MLREIFGEIREKIINKEKGIFLWSTGFNQKAIRGKMSTISFKTIDKLYLNHAEEETNQIIPKSGLEK